MIRLCGNCLGGQVPRVVMGCGHWFPTEKESWCLGEKERMEVSGKWETLVFAQRKGLWGSWTGTALCTLRPWVQRGRRRREHEPSFVVDVSQEQHETSVVSLCLRICLPMQRTWVWSLDQEDPTCQGASEPVPHTHWAWVLHNRRTHHSESPHTTTKKSLNAATRESPSAATRTQHSEK